MSSSWSCHGLLKHKQNPNPCSGLPLHGELKRLPDFRFRGIFVWLFDEHTWIETGNILWRDVDLGNAMPKPPSLNVRLPLRNVHNN